MNTCSPLPSCSSSIIKTAPARKLSWKLRARYKVKRGGDRGDDSPAISGRAEG